MTLITYKWSIEAWHELVNSGVLAGQIVEYKAGTVTPLTFPQIAIALDRLLLYGNQEF